MCGIVGTVNKPFGNDTLDLIKHRGPDDGDIVNLNIAQNDICLGHRRLSIQDLSAAGHQPMWSACGKFVIIFNGEIYNHWELREKLPDIEWRGHSDTETIVNYIARYGIESVRDFNGIFGFGLFNTENNRLYVARDRYGVKPVYYHCDNTAFLFASEIKPILHLINDFSINEESLNSYLTLRYNPSPNTIILGINKLKPGEIIGYDIENHKLHNVFNLNESVLSGIKIDRTKNEAYWIDALSEKLEEAVQRQMISDVEVGSFLSGGIDSALITSIAAKYSKDKIKTFCVGFEGADENDDETKEAQISAQLLGTSHYQVIVNPNDYYQKYLKESMFMLEEPNGSAATFAQYEVSKLASQYVKVALAGQGADEILMGYPKYFAEVRRKKYLLPLMFAKKLDFIFERLGNDKIKRALYALSENNEKLRYVKTRAVFTEEEKKLLLRRYQSNDFHEFDFYFDRLSRNLHPADKFAVVDTYTQLADELLMYGDKTTMATSLEMRVPFLDNELVDLIQTIPLEYKINQRNQKYILKKVAEKYLPQEIINRKKKGFAMPILKWFQEDLQEQLMLDLVERKAFVHEYMEKDKIRELILKYKTKEEKDYRKLLLILHFNAFGEVYENFC